MISYGQQPGCSFEQPTIGNSSILPPNILTDAKCGVVQEPARSAFPVNVATFPPLLIDMADSIDPVAVDAITGMVLNFVKVTWVTDTVLLILADVGAQPTKFGTVTLKVAQVLVVKEMAPVFG